MLAEKCPNCGAFLPVRKPGVTVRTCEFCGLEVPGHVVEVERLTAPRMAVRPPLDSSDTATPAARGAGVFIVIALVVGVIAAIVVIAATSKTSLRAPATATQAEAEAPAAVAAAATASAPAEKPEAKALREAIAQAGGASSVDLVALGAFAEAKVKTLATDAVPILFNCTYVRADGRADLTLQNDARCTWEYRAPSRVKRPDGTPAGITVSVPCVLSFTAGASNMSTPPA